ncbi:hypothetical protein HS088_TW03G00512 [Tripterygium wilfordii]|uniref:AP2/ERF domain-containing protein n=1 Tax=Tripterygium wilfordii TaxID=458696 RepID=A0A7J7DUY2_TRIWF|nr:ethylene-responsive transcription factor ERF015 [Tripterygium wilfordii]KAF5750180.1 hypothetical protein HS088_TW03G00512 [Tripterygium wilfordii]
MDRVPTSPPKEVRRGRPPGRYRGVRRREWGKWVSEIRVPKTGKRIWLGSYDAPEKAARAYDAARYCIHGECGPFNFPTERRPTLPEGFVHFFSKTEVKAIASDFALAHEAVSESDPIPDSVNLNVPSATGSADKIDQSASLTESDYGFIENLELDDFLMFDFEWLSDIS